MKPHLCFVAAALGMYFFALNTIAHAQQSATRGQEAARGRPAEARRRRSNETGADQVAIVETRREEPRSSIEGEEVPQTLAASRRGRATILARQPSFVAGHSLGGGLASTASLRPEARLEDDEDNGPPVCKVCGEIIQGGPVILCTSCRTPHHRECWEYVGSCSIYGCGSKVGEAGLAG